MVRQTITRTKYDFSRNLKTKGTNRGIRMCKLLMTLLTILSVLCLALKHLEHVNFHSSSDSEQTKLCRHDSTGGLHSNDSLNIYVCSIILYM